MGLLYANNDIREGKSVQIRVLTGNLAQRYRQQVDARDRFYIIQPELIGEFQTGSIGHTVLTGLDVQHEKRNFYGLLGSTGAVIDVFNPDFSVPVPPVDPNLIRPSASAILSDCERHINWLLLTGSNRPDHTMKIIVRYSL